jgi:flagellar hook-basal body complex protein FliE
MVDSIHFSQASAAYKNASKMQQSSSEASLTESPMLPNESKSRFEPSFEELVTQGLDKARDANYKGEATSAEALANKAEYHQLVTAVNNAELTLRTVVGVRDRMISAYQEIIKMPI